MLKTILIVGGGIAGLTAAHWLSHYGLNVELIEKNSHYPRKEGYLMDFWGAGYDVCEKMDLLPLLSLKDFLPKDFIFIDAEGNETSRFSVVELRAYQKQRALMLFRGDIENSLYEKVSPILSIQTNTTITHLINHANGVDVFFNNGAHKKYDLVIGADGAHSKTREQAFGPEKNFSNYLGLQVAVCVQPYDQPLDKSIYTYFSPGRQITACMLDNNRIATFYGYLEAAEKVDNPKEKLIAAFANAKWIAPELIENLKKTASLFCDGLSQITVPQWYQNNVVLIGDACHCLTLAAGQGASMAMAGAYILSTLINQHRNDHHQAFSEYQRIMQPGIFSKQQESKNFIKSYIPDSFDGEARRHFYTRYFFRAMFEKTEIERFCAG